MCKKLDITTNTYYRWRKEYGGLKVDQAKRLKELDRESARLKKLLAEAHLDNAIRREAAKGNRAATSAGERPYGACRRCWGVSERRACRVLGQPLTTQREEPKPNSFEKRLVARIIELACQFGRYGYRRITALLRREGWPVNHKRVQRIWRR